ncbi:MAG: hypothetical protein E7472_05030 [Ruminococcaceae bacterium]|nr:hypothetical protein [Oscillospiraceae bacterium]
MITVRDLRLGVGEKETKLPALAARALGLRAGEIRTLTILKKSLDARKKDSIRWLYTVAVELADEQTVLRRADVSRVSVCTPYCYEIPAAKSAQRPVVVGFGPAGMFAALLLAEAGLRPLILERGADVDTRTEHVRRFWTEGVLSGESNVQFGEGGAGTFSDGKLNTGTHDGRIRFVLQQLVRFGAPEHIAWDAKPHVGTDVLVRVVKTLREHILALGGEIRFLTRFTGFETAEDGSVCAVLAECGGLVERIAASDLILAPGHSARDTFAMLHARGVPLERKAFSMGVRIEHKQSEIGLAQYGKNYVNLPAADYKLNVRLDDGTGVYTFCMCPGGYVVAAASEHGGVCTNGMSYSGRSGENANSAVLVTLQPEEFPGEGVLAGMEWQREIERACFNAAGGTYAAPAQRVEDFLARRPSAAPGAVVPTYRPGVCWCDLHTVLPQRLTQALEQAIPALGKRLRGFDAPDAVLTAPETRSSSPIRILRSAETLQSAAAAGLYPCGEGAGYAGGITSAAVDGMRCAEHVIARYKEA